MLKNTTTKYKYVERKRVQSNRVFVVVVAVFVKCTKLHLAENKNCKVIAKHNEK